MPVKNSINNGKCRKFLKLKNKHAAYYVLKKSPLIKKGKSSATFYINVSKKFEV